MLVGAALGLAGAVMQGVTRNPLADPGILGITMGASLAVVTGIAFFGLSSATSIHLGGDRRARRSRRSSSTPSAPWGAAAPTPLKLALAGAATVGRAQLVHQRHPAAAAST